MSPVGKAVSDLENAPAYWTWLLKTSLVLVPVTCAAFLAVAGFYWREITTKVSIEEYRKDQQQINQAFAEIDARQRQRADLLSRIDERTNRTSEDMRIVREEIRAVREDLRSRH